MCCFNWFAQVEQDEEQEPLIQVGPELLNIVDLKEIKNSDTLPLHIKQEIRKSYLEQQFTSSELRVNWELPRLSKQEYSYEFLNIIES